MRTLPPMTFSFVTTSPRWDLNMGQRGQLDRIPVAHSGPVLDLDWVLPSSAVPATLASTKPPATSSWYGGSGGGFFDDILPSVPIATGNTGTQEKDGPGWLISGGMDRCVKVCPPFRGRSNIAKGII